MEQYALSPRVQLRTAAGQARTTDEANLEALSQESLQESLEVASRIEAEQPEAGEKFEAEKRRH